MAPLSVTYRTINDIESGRSWRKSKVGDGPECGE